MEASFSLTGLRLLQAARQVARDYRHSIVTTEHMMLALLQDPLCAAGSAMEALKQSREYFRLMLVRELSNASWLLGRQEPTNMCPALALALKKAQEEAKRAGAERIGSLDLLLGLATTPDHPGALLLKGSCIDAAQIRALRPAVEGVDASHYFPNDDDTLKTMLIVNDPQKRGSGSRSLYELLTTPKHERRLARRVMTRDLNDLFSRAKRIAGSQGHAVIQIEHLLLGLLAQEHGESFELRTSLGVKSEPLRLAALRGLMDGMRPIALNDVKVVSLDTERVLWLALHNAHGHDRPVSCGDLLLGMLLHGDNHAAPALRQAGVTPRRVREWLDGLAGNHGDDPGLMV